jgi:cell division GTPase FtsZ
MPTNLQILNQIEFVEITIVESIKEIISQPVIEGQSNLDFELTF